MNTQGGPAKVWREGDGVHIDVRGLPPPQPLTQVLRLVMEIAEAPPAPGGAVIVHLDRDPVLLYPELVQLGWWADRVTGEPGEVRLRLAPAAG
ncbi:MAG: DUF2249 domain-containing protein [Rubrivivax sp.]|nr:DUF2249 domain-containing protein [Rubrivivax sp.]